MVMCSFCARKRSNWLRLKQLHRFSELDIGTLVTKELDPVRRESD
jgi:hypothetical protein